MIENLTRPVSASDGFVSITRTIPAPAALVFEAWTDPLKLARWYAPPGCSISVTEMDLRMGGGYRTHLSNPNWHDCRVICEFLEVERPSRLVFKMVMADDNWNPTSPAELGMDATWPKETVVSLTIVEREGVSVLTLQQNVPDELARKTGAYPSWLAQLDQLDQLLAGAGSA